MSPEDLVKINPEFEQILKETKPGTNLDFGFTTDIPQLRANLLKSKLALTAANTSSTELAVTEEDRQIPVRDGTTITVRIHKPKNPPAGGSPVFVIYHGGGFCLGSLDSETLTCRNWVTNFGGVAVNVGYRLAPEHPFPTGVNDAYDALKWTAANLDELKVDAKKGFLLGGVSAGGNFAVVASHLYRDEGISPPLTGLYLSIAAVMDEETVPEKYRHEYISRGQNFNAPVLGGASVELFNRNYKPDIWSPLYAPFLFPSHKDLPPSYFQICGMDPLRDDGIIYERVLREDYGIKTKVHLYPGLPHGFWTAFPQASFTKKYVQDSIDGLRWLVEQGGK